MTNQIKQFLQEAKDNGCSFTTMKIIRNREFELKLSNGVLVLVNLKDYTWVGSTDPDDIATFNSLFSDNIQDKVKEYIEEMKIDIKVNKETLEINDVHPDRFEMRGEINAMEHAISIIKKHLLKGSE